MIGHDASQHSFVIQMPVPRSSRREERIMQLFRMLNWSVKLLDFNFLFQANPIIISLLFT
jgi:hypothetical protein